MKARMRQVSAAEFKVLSVFHPAEVRYYVDVSKPLPRKTGCKRKRRAKKKPVEKS